MRDKMVKNLFLLLSFALAAFPIQSFGLRSVILVLWVCLGFIMLMGKPSKHVNLTRSRLLRMGVSILPFLILMSSLLYTKNASVGIEKLMQMSPLLLIPLVLGINFQLFTMERIHQIAMVFSLCVLSLVLYELAFCVLNWSYLVSEPSLDELKYNNLKGDFPISEVQEQMIKLRRFRNFVEELSSSHPTYQSIWSGFAIYVFGAQMLNKNSIVKQIGFGLTSLVLFIWMILLSSRMPIVASLIGIMAAIFVSSLSLQKKGIIAVAIVLFAALSYSSSEDIRLRIKEVVQTGLEKPKVDSNVDAFNSTNVRNGIYYCFKEVIRDNYIIGVGVGDLQLELNACYQNQLGAKIYTWRDYNTHNQYMFFWAASGFLGLLAFLWALAHPLVYAIRRKHLLQIFFLIQISVTLLSENVISRSDGVLYYAIFNGLFYLTLMSSLHKQHDKT